jgi:pimeloyl-ACP methyl ester carboxylesterase
MTGTPVMFIHGLWLHSTSWGPWLELFTERGYATSAPDWPGIADTVLAARDNPAAIADHGIEDVARHYAGLIDRLPAKTKPVLIGHSFGGLIAEKLLGEDRAAAAIAIDAAQIKGVLPIPISTLRSTLPVFRNPANRHRAVSLTADQFRYSFGNAVSQAESDELFARWAIPAPGKPLFEAATANFAPHSPAAVEVNNSSRGPLLLITGGQDHTVPEAVTRATYRQYRHSEAVTELAAFADRGHSLTIDSGWREVADHCLDWLDRHGLGPTPGRSTVDRG